MALLCPKRLASVVRFVVSTKGFVRSNVDQTRLGRLQKTDFFRARRDSGNLSKRALPLSHYFGSKANKEKHLPDAPVYSRPPRTFCLWLSALRLHVPVGLRRFDVSCDWPFCRVHLDLAGLLAFRVVDCFSNRLGCGALCAPPLTEDGCSPRLRPFASASVLPAPSCQAERRSTSLRINAVPCSNCATVTNSSGWWAWSTDPGPHTTAEYPAS